MGLLRIGQAEATEIGETEFFFYEGLRIGGVWQVGMACLPSPPEAELKK